MAPPARRPTFSAPVVARPPPGAADAVGVATGVVLAGAVVVGVTVTVTGGVAVAVVVGVLVAVAVAVGVGVDVSVGVGVVVSVAVGVVVGAAVTTTVVVAVAVWPSTVVSVTVTAYVPGAPQVADASSSAPGATSGSPSTSVQDHVATSSGAQSAPLVVGSAIASPTTPEYDSSVNFTHGRETTSPMRRSRISSMVSAEPSSVVTKPPVAAASAVYWPSPSANELVSSGKTCVLLALRSAVTLAAVRVGSATSGSWNVSSVMRMIACGALGVHERLSSVWLSA